MNARFSLVKTGSVAFALSLGIFGFSSAAKAHNSLASSEPASGAVLDVAPTSWSLTFTGDVPLESASAEIVRADGTRTALQPPTHGASTSVIVFALPQDLAGNITGRWRLVGTDGHVITGRVEFSVSVEQSTTSVQSTESDVPVEGDIEAVPSTTTPEVDESIEDDISITEGDTVSFAEPTPESIRWVLQILAYIGLVAVGGLVFADVVLARGILRRPRAILAAQAGALSLFISAGVQILIYLADIAGVSVLSAFDHLGSTFDTTAGSMLAIRTLIGFIVLMATLTFEQSRVDRRFVRGFGALIALYIVTVPFTGHSRSMRWPAIGVPADVVHLIGVTVWMGGLLALVAFVMPAAQSAGAVTAYMRFSTYASWAVAAIVVTGVIQTIRLHERPSAFFDSAHGIVLVVKILLVAVMLGVGWRNRKLLQVEGRTPDSNLRAHLIRVTALEAGVGVLVIGASAALVRASFSG